MAVLQYQNPSSVDAVLDSVSLGGSPEVRREIVVIGDSSGTVALVSGRVPVDGSGVTQPVSGTVTAAQATAANLNATVVFPSAQHVIIDSATLPAVDVTDRAARLLGHVTVDNASIAVTGTFFQATQPVSIAAAVDISDRAARLLGVVYGSQGQQLKQTATNFNLQVELATAGTLYDARQIRALTSADVVSAAQSGLWNVNQAIGVAGFGKVTDGSNTAAVKAASTAPVATDPALVVAISPNTPTLPVSGTIAVTQSTSPWVANVSQFGGNNVVTGTGASGVGIPRVTVSNDSNVIVTQAAGNWNDNIAAFGGTAVSLGAKASASSIPVVLATDEATLPVSIAATVNVSVQNATLAVTQSTSPWVSNVTQFGSSNVVTGTGVSGAGIPRVTVSSDSFPATQPVSVATLPLPANAAQETGGNLATIATQTQNNAKVVDVLASILSQMKLLNLNLSTCIPSAYVDGDTILLDAFPTV